MFTLKTIVSLNSIDELLSNFLLFFKKMANVQLKPLRSSKTRTNYISPINPETKQRIKSAGKSTKKGPNNKNDKDKQNQQLNSSSNKLEEIKFFDIDHSKNNSTTANSEVNFEIDVAEIVSTK